MNRNVGLFDRLFRVTLAGVFIYFLLYGAMSVTVSVIAAVMAIILLATGILGMCPLYSLLGWSTDKKNR